MVQILRHSLNKQAYDLCLAIEAIKDYNGNYVCSESQTEAVCKASALLMAIDKFLDKLGINEYEQEVARKEKEEQRTSGEGKSS